MLFALSKAVVSDAKQNARLQRERDCGATSMVKHENLVYVFFSFRCKYFPFLIAHSKEAFLCLTILLFRFFFVLVPLSLREHF